MCAVISVLKFLKEVKALGNVIRNKQAKTA